MSVDELSWNRVDVINGWPPSRRSLAKKESYAKWALIDSQNKENKQSPNKYSITK